MPRALKERADFSRLRDTLFIKEGNRNNGRETAFVGSDKGVYPVPFG